MHHAECFDTIAHSVHSDLYLINMVTLTISTAYFVYTIPVYMSKKNYEKIVQDVYRINLDITLFCNKSLTVSFN